MGLIKEYIVLSADFEEVEEEDVGNDEDGVEVDFGIYLLY